MKREGALPFEGSSACSRSPYSVGLHSWASTRPSYGCGGGSPVAAITPTPTQSEEPLSPLLPPSLLLVNLSEGIPSRVPLANIVSFRGISVLIKFDASTDQS